MKILVTGFKPFLNNDVNTSGEVLKLINDEEVKTLLLDVSYSKTPLELNEVIEEYQPDFILSLGLFAKLNENIQIERCAYNLMSSKGMDNDGIIKDNEIIDKDKRDFYLNPIDFDELESYLNENNVEFHFSDNPGRYICNLVYFNILAYSHKGLFIHLPLIKNKGDLEKYHLYVELVLKFIKENY